MAYRTFHNAYFDRLLRYLLVGGGGDEEAAREALQLTLVRVVRHVKVFDAEEKFLELAHGFGAQRVRG